MLTTPCLDPAVVRQATAAVMAAELALLEEERALAGRLTPDQVSDRSMQSVLLAQCYRDCLQHNDLTLIEALIPQVAVAHGLAIEPESAQYRVLGRQLLRGMVRVFEVDADREMGIYPEDQGALSLEPAWATPSLPVAPVAPVVRAQPAPAPAEVDDSRGELFSAAMERLIVAKEEEGKRKDTLRDFRNATRLFVEFLGDKPVGQVTRQDAFTLRGRLAQLPYLHGKSVYTGLSPTEAIALVEKRDADRQMEIDRQLEDGDVDPDNETMVRQQARERRLALKTINKHLDSCGQLFKWLDPAGSNQTNPFFKTRFELDALPACEEREAFPPEDIRRIFMEKRWAEPTDRDGDYWVPLIETLMGLRLEEACQLWCEDIVEEDGIPCVFVHKGAERMTKTPESTRKIPIHPLLIRLGLLNHVAAQRRAGKYRLFPELRRDPNRDRLGTYVGKRFGYLLRQAGLYRPGRTAHSLRHSFATELDRAGVRVTVIADLMGHVKTGETAGRYIKPATMPERLEAISRLDYGLDFLR